MWDWWWQAHAMCWWRVLAANKAGHTHTHYIRARSSILVWGSPVYETLKSSPACICCVSIHTRLQFKVTTGFTAHMK